jgi:DNA-directed RNA polymerase specialized sigma24 family protein
MIDMDKELLEVIDAKLRALLAVSALQLSEDKDKPRKIEQVLSECGIRPDEIASITGKSEGAIRKTLQRAGVHLRKTEAHGK